MSQTMLLPFSTNTIRQNTQNRFHPGAKLGTHLFHHTMILPSNSQCLFKEIAIRRREIPMADGTHGIPQNHLRPTFATGNRQV